jgi:hypothetical protein
LLTSGTRLGAAGLLAVGSASIGFSASIAGGDTGCPQARAEIANKRIKVVSLLILEVLGRIFDFNCQRDKERKG